MRLLTILVAGLTGLLIHSSAMAQNGAMAMPTGANPGAAATANSNANRSLPSQTPPSLQGNGAAGQLTAGGKLPRGNNQEHRVYDLRPYTGYLTKLDHPEQAVVDWVLRETGTDLWFTAPFGFMNADRDKLQVYHTPEVHQMVGNIVNRFVAGDREPQMLSLRVLTVGNPNWRSQAHLLMQHVNVESPGVQAWLLSKENAAIIAGQLRARTDVRQVQSIDLVTYNGQTEKLASTRGRNYVRNVKQALTGWPPYEPETGEIQEGYRLEISPLLSTDGAAVDCVIKAGIDQVDQLKPVDLNLPLPNAQTHRARIEVPQVVSWRLHERFRWPSDMVLLLSCGVVASPERPQATIPLLNLDMITGTTAGRADALLFIQFRGRASDTMTTTPLAPQVATGLSAPNRGRY